MEEKVYRRYVELLRKELIPAMGCTEPIAIAYGCARARVLLEVCPERVTVAVSGNIIKNVKSVVVPNTGGQKGILVAVAAGIIAGKAEKRLEVISQVTEEQIVAIAEYAQSGRITIKVADSNQIFDIDVRMEAAERAARVRIVENHLNIVREEKNGEVLLDLPVPGELQKNGEVQEEQSLTVEEIYEFANTCRMEDVEPIVRTQMEQNWAIAKEGMEQPWGARVGETILKNGDPQNPRTRAVAYSAAGSDARMSGCEMPVIINSGSGNQGITVSVPVTVYARHLGADLEKTCRALVLANLISIHEKSGIGRLSAYCGAVTAGCAAGAGICYLMGGDLRGINHTIVNSLAITSGIICDGAKPSCAAKIAMALEGALLGLDLFQNGQQFRAGEGIIKKGVEPTIESVGRLGRDGMRETDKEILQIMVE